MGELKKKYGAKLDYRVCKEAMDNPDRMQELNRWGREEIRLAENEMPGFDGFEKRVCQGKTF